MFDQISLNGSDWTFKGFYGEDWLWRKSYLPETSDYRWWRRGSVPGSVLDDLRRLGEVPNPYYELNSQLCEWVPQRTWLYRKVFTVPEVWRQKRVQLHFKGVDYQSRFYLNGVCLGSHTGMYTPVNFDVTGCLKFGQENTLVVVIDSAPSEQPQVGYTSRVNTHKGRMGYWWDFCPRMIHQGIWDDVYLEATGALRIEDVFVRSRLKENHTRADITVAVELEAPVDVRAVVQVNLFYAGSTLIARNEERILPAGQTRLEYEIAVDRPRLWWPNGYGEQPLYEAEVVVLTEAEVSAQRRVTFGIRSLEMVTNENADPQALPYTLVVNGRRIYIKGWNWVPVDALFGVPRPEKLDHLLRLAQQANVNLLRVWGGGLIEKDAFYEACDRLGILVWQEFIQSSSGIDNHPATSPEHIALLAHEAERIVPLKRNHPALALWCGGNELQDDGGRPLDDTHPTLAALKAVVARLDPDRLWLATSPTGKVFGNTLEAIARNPADLHDVHGPWEYQGAAAQVELYNQGSSLLHSEFGVEGITNLKTLNATIHPSHQWPVSLDSNPYWWHLGAWWVRRKVWDQVFGELPDVETYVQATQFTQADGLRYALEADRRRKYHNSGTLPWQFNEPYPMAACTSSVDYYGHPKPAYYAVAAAYAPVHVSARFPTLAWGAREEFEADVWVCNSSLVGGIDADLEVRLVGASGKVYAQWEQRAAWKADGATRLAQIRAPIKQVEEVFFLDILARHALGEAANCYVFTRAENLRPLLELPETNLEVQRTVDGEAWTIRVRNSGLTTAMFVWLEDARLVDAAGFAYFDRNYFCLFPGEAKLVRVTRAEVPPGDLRVRVKGWNTQCLLLQEGKEA